MKNQVIRFPIEGKSIPVKTTPRPAPPAADMIFSVLIYEAADLLLRAYLNLFRAAGLASYVRIVLKNKGFTIFEIYYYN